MRALGLVWVVGCFSAALGCTAILGDFTLGTTSTATDGGDAGGSEAGSDAGSDAPIAKVLSCTELAKPARGKIASFTLGGNNSQYRQQIYLFQVNEGLNNGKEGRLLLNDTNGQVLTYDIDFEQGSLKQGVTIPPITGAQNGVQLITAARTPTSIEALVLDFGSGALMHYTLLDNLTTWTPSGTLAMFGGFCIRSASLSALDPSNEIAVVTLAPNNTCQNGPFTLQAFEYGTITKTATWPATTFAGSAAQSIATDVGKVYAVVSPNSNSQSGSAPGLYVAQRSDMTLVGNPQPFMLNDPASLFDLLAMEPSAAAGKANMAIFGGNVSAQSFSLYAGGVTLSSLGGSKPQATLTETKLAGIADLPIEQARARWRNFPNAEELVVSSLIAQQASLPGVNFYWFDSDGTNLGRKSGATALFTDDPNIAEVDVDFMGAPIGRVVGSFGAAFISEHKGKGADGGIAEDIYVAGIGCSAK